MSRESKQWRRARRSPIAVDTKGDPIDPNVAFDLHQMTRWQWGQLQRAQRMVRRYPQVLVDLQDLYVTRGHGTTSIQRMLSL